MPIPVLYAMAHMEGFYVPNSRAARNHNPGNLNMEAWELQFGAALEPPPHSGPPRFAAFPDDDSGTAAMRFLLNRDYAGMTLTDALNKWAPPSDGNDHSAYLGGVMQMTGLTADTVLTPDNIG